MQHFVIAKIIIRDKSLYFIETAYIVLSSLVMSIFVVISIAVFDFSTTLSSAVMPLFCIIYFYKIQSYSFIKALSLAFISIFIVIINDIFVMAIVNLSFPSFFPSIPNFPLPIGFTFNLFLQYIPYTAFTYALSILASFLFIKLTKNQRELINQSDKAQMVLAGGSLFSIIISVIFVNVWRYFGASAEFLTWNAITLSGMLFAGFVSIVLYARSLKERIILEQKETEQKILQRYTYQVEEQQRIIQQIQHDIGNILASMEGYLEKGDLNGLIKYFNSKIKTTVAGISADNATLSRLANINIPEIKATLAGKLMLAQSIGINTTLEVTDKIDHIPVDSIALVRMLGIILDNAIEELQESGVDKGKLVVACYKSGCGVTFVVRNSCRPDTPKLHELEKIGFSTKGTGRGLGLDNLIKIVDSHSDKISLRTTIADGNFTQFIRIGGIS